ncbi:MAG TPA: PilZ domain-containing protein [Desulfocapsa sulfexigens]|nr:PilZ domain-containing protein [Desulfocapsa sulfexigens]
METNCSYFSRSLLTILISVLWFLSSEYARRESCTSRPIRTKMDFSSNKRCTMKNRRDYERLLIRKFALLKLANGEIIEGQTRDMSVGGAFIECEPDVDLSEGTECTIRLMLDEEGRELTTEIYGTITHSDSEGLGCHFLKVNAIYYQFIGALYD